jgi:hypothetical protein
MSIRTCCGRDENKGHTDDCPKQLEWKRKQNERVRQANKRQARVTKDSERRSKG